MSKCDFQIVFDRPDRTYRGGEQVTGTIRVQVNRDFSCDALVLEHYWKTHGRGNTARGEVQSLVLPPATFRAGETFSHPFRFTAPDGPPTYHGEHLNVDHYVKVHADVPWAIDPKKEEDYILLPGSRDWENRPGPGQARKTGTKRFPIAAVIGMVLIIAGLIFFLPFGFIFVVIGCIVLLSSLMRRWLPEAMLGPVDAQWGSLEVAPGGRLPVRLSLAPRKSLAINGITAQLTGQEKCVSGSGTNTTTHKHVLYQHTATLAPAIQLAAGQPVEFSGLIEIPSTAAYSFHATNNDLIWSVQLRIDIPRWPDWGDEATLAVRPRFEPAGAEAPIEAEVVPERVAEDRDSRAQPRSGPVLAASSEEGPAPVPERLERVSADVPAREASPAQPTAAAASLTEIAQEILSARPYSSEREASVAGHEGESFDCVLEVERVERTFGLVPESFRDGHTAIGVVAGTGCKAALQLPAGRNEEARSLQPGQRVCARVALLKWDIIYERLELREAEPV
jgi:hypothetical protein